MPLCPAARGRDGNRPVGPMERCSCIVEIRGIGCSEGGRRLVGIGMAKEPRIQLTNGKKVTRSWTAADVRRGSPACTLYPSGRCRWNVAATAMLGQLAVRMGLNLQRLRVEFQADEVARRLGSRPLPRPLRACSPSTGSRRAMPPYIWGASLRNTRTYAPPPGWRVTLRRGWTGRETTVWPSCSAPLGRRPPSAGRGGGAGRPMLTHRDTVDPLTSPFGSSRQEKGCTPLPGAALLEFLTAARRGCAGRLACPG